MCWYEALGGPDHKCQSNTTTGVGSNTQTEYLGGFLNSQPDKEHFKKKVPIVNYEDIKPYIERIANGEPSQIISAQPITELLTSSGTSAGKPKMMPSTTEELDRKTFFITSLYL